MLRLLLSLLGVLVALVVASSPWVAEARDKAAKRAAYCAKQRWASERVICRDKDLARRDGVLNEVYRELRRKLSKKDFRALRKEQRAWLRERNRCGSKTSCLVTKYEDRVAYLEQMLESLENPNNSHVETGCDGEGQKFVNGECVMDRGVDSSSSGPVLREKNKTCDLYGNKKSRDSDAPVTVTFVNRTDGLRSVMWINFEGTPVEYASLNPGQSYTINTFLTHPWMFTDGPGNCIEMFMPKRGISRFEITAASPFFGPGQD